MISKEEVNNEPVLFCKHCLSLNIKDYSGQTSEDGIELKGTEFCDDCTSTDIAMLRLTQWENLYKIRYNKKFFSNGKNY